ncbi:UNVERIFIED_CONTAM: hypothetical protein GTU68_025533 [Idotea baltica]|nr:hypothetical protein [Idotea baltica]
MVKKVERLESQGQNSISHPKNRKCRTFWRL